MLVVNDEVEVLCNGTPTENLYIVMLCSSNKTIFKLLYFHEHQIKTSFSSCECLSIVPMILRFLEMNDPVSL